MYFLGNEMELRTLDNWRSSATNTSILFFSIRKCTSDITYDLFRKKKKEDNITHLDNTERRTPAVKKKRKKKEAESDCKVEQTTSAEVSKITR